jgi:hypothetical protein
MSGGRAARQKGDRHERKIVNSLKEAGIGAERVPLSGAVGGTFGGDIHIGSFRAEVKARANGEGFRSLERWKGDNDFLILARDRAEPQVLMDMELFQKLLTAYLLADVR